MRTLSAFALSALTAAAMAAPIDDLRAATELAWGAGQGLAPAYATLNSTVEVRVTLGILPISQTQEQPFQESLIPKGAGSFNFNFNAQSISPDLPPLIVNLVGTQIGNDARWTINQTFSQTGGFPVSFTIDINGTPTQVNLNLNNIVTTGTLRATLASTPPFFNSVLAKNSQVRGTHTGGDAENRMDFVTTNIQGTILGIRPSRIEVRVRRIQHIMHTPFQPTVTGTVNLADISSGPAGEPVMWTLKRTDGSTAASGVTTLNASGQYTFGTDAPVGANYQLLLKGSTHLAKATPITLAASTTVPSVGLRNGDCNGDNEVGPGDFSLLSGAFGTFSGDSGFNASADLNRDGEVGPADFAILSANFGEFGD